LDWAETEMKVNYQEGNWFAVPLRDSDYAVRIVARSNPKAALLGYLFGPRLDEVRALRRDDAILVGSYGPLGSIQGRWPNRGSLPNWDRSEWPMLVFVRYEGVTGRSFNVTYDEDDLARRISEEQMVPRTAEVEGGDEPWVNTATALSAARRLVR
jgi:hypothetical protein